MTKYGHYTVNGLRFETSFEAHVYAIPLNAPILWHYHVPLFGAWEGVKINSSVDDLYKARAQQLRDKYDYLILNYSGGADSHNVLMSFINNNIHLDQVTVRFPFSIINAGLHNPSLSTDPSNRYSEWDYTIKPVLDKLAQTHPQIKIELLDWTAKDAIDRLTEKNIFDVPRGGYFLGSVLRSATISIDPGERTMVDAGKSVALIWGIDKPRIFARDTTVGSQVWLHFPDKPMVINSPSAHNPEGTEYFYWTPDMPELAWKMAYALFQWFDDRPHEREILVRRAHENRNAAAIDKWRRFCETSSEALYPSTWTPGGFMTRKPGFGIASLSTRPGDIIVEALPEFQALKAKLDGMRTPYDKVLDRNYMTVLPNGELSAVPAARSYKVATFTQ